MRGDLAALEVEQSHRGIHRFAHDARRLITRCLFDLDPATVASDDRDALARAVNDKTKIVLARDVHGLLDQHALHALPLRTGLGGDQGPTDHFIGRRAHFFNGVGQLDATGLAAAAGVDLRLDHEAADAEFLGHGHRLFHAVRHAARGHRYAVLTQQILRLVFVDIHAARSWPTLIRAIFSMTTSAWRIEAASSMRPSSVTAPWPRLAASAMASRIRWARVTSASVGVNTSFASAICEGWIAHLPSTPSAAAARAAAR